MGKIQTVRDDIFHKGIYWLQRGTFPDGLNDSNICLMPKCSDPSTMRDLHPIALCNVTYKIVAKVLANWLKHILANVISECQSTFLKVKSITNNVLIAFDFLHYMKWNTGKKQGEVAFKIDISIAYDRVDWRYLRQLMLNMGFDQRWSNLIMMCVTTVKYTVVVNDQKVGPITPWHDLRQWDHLSPYLYLLCMEGFTALIQDAKKKSLIHGCKVKRRGLIVSSLLFAYESFFFFVRA